MFLVTFVITGSHVHSLGKKKTKDSNLECWTYSIKYFHWISTEKYFLQFCFLFLEQTKPTLTFFNIWCYIQKWISKVIQFPLVSEQVTQSIQHCIEQHYAFPCRAYKSFNLKERYFSCLALTLQLSLFRQNSVSGRNSFKVRSWRSQLWDKHLRSPSLYSAVLLSHARNKSNAARNTCHWQGQIKLRLLFIEAHCVLFRVSIESYQHAFYSLTTFVFLNSFYRPRSQRCYD